MTAAVLAAAAKFTFAGCPQQKYEAAQLVSGELRAAAAELGADRANIAATLGALNELVSATGAAGPTKECDRD
jgi:hypothetical protein